MDEVLNSSSPCVGNRGNLSGMVRDGRSGLWRSPLVWLATVVITSVLIFFYVRDKQLLASRSPDGQVQIRLWDRTNFVFDHDLRVTVNRAGHKQLLRTHLNHFCGPTRQGHVIWTPVHRLIFGN